MRNVLASLEGKRIPVQARISEFGTMGYGRLTICLADVRHGDTGRLLTDHVWTKYTARFERKGAQVGDVVTFSAVVRGYLKGARYDRDGNYVPLQIDYGLKGIREVEVLEDAA